MSSADEQGFRAQLAERIRRYADQVDQVQRQLLELNHTLLTTQQRLDAACEMFRIEFNEEPPVEVDTRSFETLPGLEPVREARRRVRSAGPSWKDTVVSVLRDAGEPLHVREIWRRMEAAGFETESKDPQRSLVAILVRHAGVVRTGPNIYGLAESSAVEHSLETDQEVRELAAHHE